MIILYRRLSLVARLTTAVFEPLSLYDTEPPIRSHDHRNRHDCFMLPIFCLGQPKITQCISGLAGMSNRNTNSRNSTMEYMVSESGSLELMQTHGKVITNSFFLTVFCAFLLQNVGSA